MTSYTIQPGDTLTIIAIHFYGDQGAAQNYANAENIYKANSSILPNINTIHAGEVIQIPDAGTAPVNPIKTGSDTSAKLVIYFNSGTYPLETAASTQYTHIILSFLILDGQQVVLSGNLGPTVMSQVAGVQAAGKKVMISFGGATISHEDYAGLVGQETEVAKQIVSVVNQYNLDGVDIDFEDSAALMFNNGYNGAQFLINLTNSLYDQLPVGKKVITHAPQPPYLCAPGSPFNCPQSQTGYVQVLNECADKISWINMQYYNNPPISSDAANTILNYEQIVNGWEGFNGLPANKLLVGKPVAPGAAGSGYMPAAQVAADIVEPLLAKYPGAFGGVMGWQYLFDQDGVWNQTLGAALG